MKPLSQITKIRREDNHITIVAQQSISIDVDGYKLKDKFISPDHRFAIIVLANNDHYKVYINNVGVIINELVYGPEVLTLPTFVCIAYVAKIGNKIGLVVNNEFALDLEDWWENYKFTFSDDKAYILFTKKTDKRQHKISLDALLNRVPRFSNKLIKLNHVVTNKKDLRKENHEKT